MSLLFNFAIVLSATKNAYVYSLKQFPLGIPHETMKYSEIHIVLFLLMCDLKLCSEIGSQIFQV